MKEQLINDSASLLAGIIIMILHEFPKSFVYNIMSKNQKNAAKNNIYKLFQYIDPIGLVFCVTSYSGFSRPYMYRIKEKKTNLILGLTGFCTLIGLLAISIISLRLLYGNNLDSLEYGFLFYFLRNFAFISCGMLLVNLFPISTFDMGLFIAGTSPTKYFSIIQNDYFIKMMLLLSLILNIIYLFSSNIVYYLLIIGL